MTQQPHSASHWHTAWGEVPIPVIPGLAPSLPEHSEDVGKLSCVLLWGTEDGSWWQSWSQLNSVCAPKAPFGLLLSSWPLRQMRALLLAGCKLSASDAASLSLSFPVSELGASEVLVWRGAVSATLSQRSPAQGELCVGDRGERRDRPAGGGPGTRSPADAWQAVMDGAHAVAGASSAPCLAARGLGTLFLNDWPRQTHDEMG